MKEVLCIVRDGQDAVHIECLIPKEQHAALMDLMAGDGAPRMAEMKVSCLQVRAKGKNGSYVVFHE